MLNGYMKPGLRLRLVYNDAAFDNAYISKMSLALQIITEKMVS
jgi:hypothetical protein